MSNNNVTFPFIMVEERHYYGPQQPWICLDEAHLWKCVEQLDLDDDATINEALDALTSDLRSWDIYTAGDFVHGKDGVTYCEETDQWSVGSHDIEGDTVRHLLDMTEVAEAA